MSINPLYFWCLFHLFFQRESFSEYLPYMAGKNKAGESLESEELKKFLQVCTQHLSSILNRLKNTLSRGKDPNIWMLCMLQDYSKSIGDDGDTLQELLDRPVDRIHEYMELLKVRDLLHSTVCQHWCNIQNFLKRSFYIEFHILYTCFQWNTLNRSKFLFLKLFQILKLLVDTEEMEHFDSKCPGHSSPAFLI